MQTRKLVFTTSAAALTVAWSAGAALAQEAGTENPSTPLYTEQGIAVALGGSIEDFTHDTPRGTTGVAGGWALIGEYGTQLPLSVEGRYIGTAQSIDGLFGLQNATLVGTSFEVVGKAKFPTDYFVRPFAFAGLGWRHYEVLGADFTTAATGINDSDDLLVIPVGLGVGMQYQGLDADLRFTFRPAADHHLIQTDDGFAPMHTWALGLRVGANL